MNNDADHWPLLTFCIACAFVLLFVRICLAAWTLVPYQSAVKVLFSVWCFLVRGSNRFSVSRHKNDYLSVRPAGHDIVTFRSIFFSCVIDDYACRLAIVLDFKVIHDRHRFEQFRIYGHTHHNAVFKRMSACSSMTNCRTRAAAFHLIRYLHSWRPKSPLASVPALNAAQTKTSWWCHRHKKDILMCHRHTATTGWTPCVALPEYHLISVDAPITEKLFPFSPSRAHSSRSTPFLEAWN